MQEGRLRSEPGRFALEPGRMAADLGRMYYANPKLNFYDAFKVLYTTPETKAGAIENLFWNTSMKWAYVYLSLNGRLPR